MRRKPSATEAPAPSAPSESSSSAVKQTGNERTTPAATKSAAGGAKRVQRYFAGSKRPKPSASPAEPVDDDSDTGSKEETDSLESDQEPVTKRKPESQAMAHSDSGRLPARSKNSRNHAAEKKPKETPAKQSRYRTRQTSQIEEAPAPKCNPGSSLSNRHGSKPRGKNPLSSKDEESKYPKVKSRYLAQKERSNLARSKRSHTGFGSRDDENQNDPVFPTQESLLAYLTAKYCPDLEGTESGSRHTKERSNLARSKSSHTGVGTGDNEQQEDPVSSEIKAENGSGIGGTEVPRSRSSKERRHRPARSKRSNTGFGSGDDENQDDPVFSSQESLLAYLRAKYCPDLESTESGSRPTKERSIGPTRNRSTQTADEYELH